MSVFTNRSSRSPEQARDYTTAVLGLLGERDPLSVLRATPSAVRDAVSGVPADLRARPEAAGKWSLLDVVRHLADSEIVWAYRLRLVLAQDRPPLTGYDQDLWAARLRYERADLDESLEEFAVVRRSNLRLFEAASPDDLARVGVHAERGEESAAHMLRLHAGHDLLHVRQLQRIREAVHA
jgi:uncharacterized damage-inducible protein DinB